MKPFLGINLTEDKNNTQMTGREFLVQTPSAALTQALDRSIEKADGVSKKAKLPLPLRILEYGCGIIAALIAMGIMRADATITQAYANAPALFWVCGACAVIWFVLWVIGKIKNRQVMGTEESAHVVSNLEGVQNAIFTELKVPEQAREVDLLMFYYKVKDGKMKIVEKGIQLAPYINPIYRVYADPENLYIANLEGKYAFPQASIRGIHTIKHHIRIAEWNKDIPMNKGIYKPYKLTVDRYDCVHCSCYHIMEVERNGEIFTVYIPCYELPVFEALTGKKAQP